MALSEYDRYSLIESFDEIRSGFLAALDQVISEMRPMVTGCSPEIYSESVRACAEAFADSDLIRRQLETIHPGILSKIEADNLDDAHLAAVSYLFSVVLHELMRNHPSWPEDNNHNNNSEERKSV